MEKKFYFLTSEPICKLRIGANNRCVMFRDVVYSVDKEGLSILNYKGKMIASMKDRRLIAFGKGVSIKDLKDIEENIRRCYFE